MEKPMTLLVWISAEDLRFDNRDIWNNVETLMSYQFRPVLEVFAWLQKWWDALWTFAGHSHMLNLTGVETDSENEETQEQKDNTENERNQKQHEIGKSLYWKATFLPGCCFKIIIAYITTKDDQL